MNESRNSIKRGQILEIAVVEKLELEGWTCWRTVAGGGTGAVDIICVQLGRLALLTVSMSTREVIDPFNRTRLIQLAKHLNAEAIEVVQSRGLIAFIQLWPEGNRQWGNLPIPEQLNYQSSRQASATSINSRVLAYLGEHPLLMAVEIAEALNEKRTSVGAFLHRDLSQGKVTRTDTYPHRWSLVQPEASES